MFDDSSIIVGLEIGTSKVCAVVGERNADGLLNVIGLGQARSRGVRKGEIVDPTQAEEDVRNAIVEAEQMADVEIRNVYLGVTGIKLSGATAGTMSVGTNGVASSPWVNFDTWAAGTTSVQCVASGTVNYTIETTNDDPNSYGNPVARTAVTWDAAAGGLINQTASGSVGFPEVYAVMRVLLNSQTNPGYVRATFVQHASVTY